MTHKRGHRTRRVLRGGQEVTSEQEKREQQEAVKAVIEWLKKYEGSSPYQNRVNVDFDSETLKKANEILIPLLEEQKKNKSFSFNSGNLATDHTIEKLRLYARSKEFTAEPLTESASVLAQVYRKLQNALNKQKEATSNVSGGKTRRRRRGGEQNRRAAVVEAMKKGAPAGPNAAKIRAAERKDMIANTVPPSPQTPPPSTASTGSSRRRRVKRRLTVRRR